jgi:hypothetical protein
MVGDPHATLDRAAQPLGSLSRTLRSLCCWQLASTGWSTTSSTARRSALAPSSTHRIGRVGSRPRSRSPTVARGPRWRSRWRPPPGQGCLVPSTPMPNATTQVCSPKCPPSISNATRSNPLRSALMSSARRCGSWRQTAARPPSARCRTRPGRPDADRLQPDPIAARRQPAQHPLQCQPTQQLGAREQLVGDHRQLAGAVGGTDPGPLDSGCAGRRGSPSPARGHGARRCGRSCACAWGRPAQ